MKSLKRLFTLLLIASLMVFMNCLQDDDSDPGIDTWKVKSVTPSDGIISSQAEWEDFVLTLAIDFDYKITGVPAGFEIVWPSSAGTWNNSVTDKIMTFTNNEITFVAGSEFSGDELTLTRRLSVSESGRTSGIIDPWVFVMEKAL